MRNDLKAKIISKHVKDLDGEFLDEVFDAVKEEKLNIKYLKILINKYESYYGIGKIISEMYKYLTKNENEIILDFMIKKIVEVIYTIFIEEKPMKLWENTNKNGSINIEFNFDEELIKIINKRKETNKEELFKILKSTIKL